MASETNEAGPPPPPPPTTPGSPQSPHTSTKKDSGVKLDNISEETASPHDSPQIPPPPKSPPSNGILKKKVSIETVTLNGREKLRQEWQDNYVPSDSENSDTRPRKQYASTPERRDSIEENDEVMARKVTKIFQEVFKEGRPNWDLKIEYYMACVGVPVAFSSLWRLPMLIANYGGGAFLFSYIVMTLLIGAPLAVMETALGQFSQLSAVQVWRCAPVMQGVGIAMILLSLITSVYNSQVVAYSVHYFFASFVNMDATIMWGECRPSWPKCYDIRSNNICWFLNSTNAVNADPEDCVDYLIPSSRYYWQEKVLRLIDLGDVGKTGHIHWDLTLCLAFVWLVTFIFLVKGIKSAGKVALITGFFPICILIAFFVFSIQKKGAQMGLKQFYNPDWDKLADYEVWLKAAEQVLFSLCVTYGSILTFSSYKKFRTEISIGATFLTIANLLLSVMATTTIFALYGALAHSIGVKDATTLMETEVSGIEVIFVFIPEVIARLFPYPHVWAIFFFLMLMNFGLHAQFSLVETSLSTVYDALPKLRRKKYIAAISLILPLFLLSIPLSSSTGLHIHSLIGSSIIGPNVLVIAIFEILTLQCIYGVKRFSRDLKFILKSEPSIFWKVCWVFVAPLTLTVMVLFAVINWEKMLFDGRRDDKDWTLYLSWILTLLPLAMIPLTFIFTVLYKLCIREPVFRPAHSWGPGCTRTREIINERKQLMQEAMLKLDGNENEAFNQN